MIAPSTAGLICGHSVASLVTVMKSWPKNTPVMPAMAKIRLASGDTVVADEFYVRESIVNPATKVAAGYQPVMPTYQGLVTEEQLIALIAYIESLQIPAGETVPVPEEEE